MRALHTVAVLDIFRQSDKAGLFLGAAGVDKIIPVDETSYAKAAQKINTAFELLLADINVNIAVVPDKSYYAGKYVPGFDPDVAERILTENLDPKIKYINISDSLKADSFYKTDLHWDQIKLTGLLGTLGESIQGYEWTIPDGLSAQYIGEFTGTYPGQLALGVDPDKLYAAVLPEGITAQYYVQKSASEFEFIDGPVYDEGSDEGYDFGRIYGSDGAHGFLSNEQYSFFLCGNPQPLVVLTNAANAGSGKRLYLFRDSSGSSIAPLIIAAADYETVTLIDYRGITTGELRRAVEFVPGSDALFLYSSQILNSPSTLDRINVDS